MKPKFGIVIIALLLSVMLTGCSTPRKLAGSTKETAKTEEKRDETITAEFRRTVDSTKTEGVEVTYTKIEFFPPEPDTLPAKQSTTKTGGPSKTVADTPKNRPKEPKEKQPLDMPSAGSTCKRPEGYFAPVGRNQCQPFAPPAGRGFPANIIHPPSYAQRVARHHRRRGYRYIAYREIRA